jgi:hypothetical protein
MQGIEFETEDEIKRKLVHIIKSDAYIRAVHHWESHNKFNPSSSPCGNADSAGGKTDLLLAPTKLLRRFDYNRRKPFPQKFLPPDNLPSHPPLNIQHHLTHPPFPDHKRDFLDPTRGFHPLISLYYLTREKIERDSVYGTGQFSNSQLSITGEVANPNAISTPIPADSMPIRQQQLNAASNEPQRPPATVTSVNELTSAKFDYNKPLPRLPAPETSNYSWISYDSTVSPSPTLPTFAQPQARDPGLPPSLHAQPREHIEIAQGELGMKNGARVNGVDEKGVDRLPSAPKSVGHEMTTSSMEKVESSGGAEKSIQTHHDHTSPFPSGAILVPELCNIRDGGRADERRHETMSSKQGTILGVLAPFPSRLAVYFKPELNGTDAPTVDETVPGPCKDDDSTVTTAIMTGLTLPEPNPSTLSPAGDETSSPVPSQAIRNVLRRMDLHFITSEIGREDEPEYFKPNANQTAQPPPQKSECGTAPWILASHQPHAPKKPVDVQFIARMADLRQQTNGTSSTSSTPQARESMALLGSPVSIASSAFSQSFSIASLPPAVEFPPTPVFMDQLLGEFCEPGAPAVSCS